MNTARIRIRISILLFILVALCAFGPAFAAGTTQKQASPYRASFDDAIFTKNEHVFFGDDHWSYTSDSLGVFIDRVYLEDCKCICLIAHIYTRNHVNFNIAAYSEDAIDKGLRGQPVKIARDHRSVYAQNGDYFWEENNIGSGIVIRNGQVYKDEVKESMMAFFPDGALSVFRPGEITPEELLAAGVTETMSFGPVLVEDSKVCEEVMNHPLAYRNPRSAIGMVEPGHYVGILVDGRQPKSIGMQFDRLAQEFVNQGCTVAYNLDGGQSTAMVFMGVQLNTHKNDSVYPLQRKVPEMYVIGDTGLKLYDSSTGLGNYSQLTENMISMGDGQP